MKKYILLAVLPAFLVSCTSKRLIVRNTPPENSKPRPAESVRPAVPAAVPPAVSAGSVPKTGPAAEYIVRFKDIAVAEMNKYGIPASITLAQGLLESGNGNSRLARESNNHFGIKCTSEWKGKTVLHDDDAVGECFRVYKDPEESFRDHSEFLKRARYAPLFKLDKNDYRGWAEGLKQAGYATNPRYAELLVGIIERYRLNDFDLRESPADKDRREDRVLEEIAVNIPSEKSPALEKAPVTMKIYEVKAGDTLSSVGKRFGLTTEQLRALNGIQGADLKEGQLLLLSM
jgi:flagellum-specific peptidoglycan hydrolase FlgJ